MRKEIVWAGIIGISFGLVIAFGIYRINSSFKNPGGGTKETPQPKPTSELRIVLDKPGQNDVITEGSVTVSGITKPLTWLVFSGEKDDYIVQADEQGVFNQEVNLIPGVNQIKVAAFDQNKEKSVEKVLVVYSSAFEVDSSLINKPKAYIGVVTDITDSTIQIKTTESETKQISVGADGITVINTKGTNNKVVKLTDIAIGDFIVAMGYVNTSSVLSAQRILITDPVTEPKTDILQGLVSDISKKSVATKIAKKFAALSPDDLVIYVVDESSGTSSVRAIFKVS